MGKRGLNIYHRKDGRWEGRYRDGYHENGKPKYRSVYAKSYSAVKERLIALHSLAEKPTGVCALTVEKIFTEWLSVKSLKVKVSTIANYQFKVEKHILSTFGKVKISDLSPKAIYGFIREKLNDGLSAKYVADIVVILKSLAKYAAKVYHCNNPIADVELPKVEKTEMKLYSKEQRKTLKKVLLSDTNQTKMGILLCLFTGIRIGELCALRWSVFDFAERTFLIRDTSGSQLFR